MYGFQNEDFLKTLNGAVAQIGEINRIADKVSDLGYKNIYLVGTGGTYAIISPLAYMLKTNSALYGIMKLPPSCWPQSPDH